MTTTVHITCLCGKNAETLQLDAHLPVSVSPCSCDECRRSTGMLYFSGLPIPSRPGVVDALTEYKSSEKLSRYFCQTCGSHMVLHVVKDDAWSVCSGVVERVVGLEQVSRLSLEKIVQHEFVGDTRDGGLAACLANFHGRSVPLFDQGPGGGELERPLVAHFDWPDSGNSSEAAITASPTYPPLSNQTNEIDAACHCGGVKFRITRPNALSSQCSSPFPDLSCRLGAGSPIQCWAFVPKANIVQANKEPLSYEMGTLKQIESSKDCFREFCRVCGATVFWHCRERPDLVDVSVGLLRAGEGSRAESLLEWWTERVSFREDALDKGLIEALEKGLRDIGRK
ncbi:hypothetical protein PV08_00457 [Exophiala spinifera]|uniref:CENP-V/GFA domain-containing protein n=1 Tax=Exophiala spinifera TaxID=91928 RepID=A0A0D2A4Y6_9EURO|nr:uncharacterized protein PV08_00457 [Exophiala spinifera]KIW19882.1 hypothetical protein PV08_00457 [Exophiala spinifera]